MKKLLVAGIAAAAFCGAPALAADMPTKAPVYKAAATAFNWTGFYIGGHVGYGWGNKDWFAPGFGPLGSHDVSGWLGGGQVGFNYQVASWVFGVEGEYSWADLDGAHVDSTFSGNNRTNVEWLGTVAGRIGYARERALLYVKGGGAWAHDEYTVTAPGFFTKASATKSGWIIGVGLEYAFMPNWSTKIEYNYVDFGNERVTFTGSSTFPRDVDQYIHTVKVGINYRFGGY